MFSPKRPPVGEERADHTKALFEAQAERRAKTPENNSRVAITGADGKEYTGTVLLADAEAGTYEAVYRNDKGELVVVEQNVEQAEAPKAEAVEAKEAAPEVSAEQVVEAKMEELKEEQEGMAAKLKKGATGFMKSFSKYFAAKTGEPLNEDAWLAEGDKMTEVNEEAQDALEQTSSAKNIKAAAMELGVGVFEQSAIPKMMKAVAETVAADLVTDELTPGRKYMERAASWLSEKLSPVDFEMDEINKAEGSLEFSKMALEQSVSAENTKLDNAVTDRRLEKLKAKLAKSIGAKAKLMTQPKNMSLSGRRDALRELSASIEAQSGEISAELADRATLLEALKTISGAEQTKDELDELLAA